MWHTHTHSLSGVLPGGGLQRTPAAEQGKIGPKQDGEQPSSSSLEVVKRERPSTQPAEIVVSKDEGSSEGRNDPWKGGRLLGLGVQVEFIHTIRFLRVCFFGEKFHCEESRERGFFLLYCY